jgi:hypothetical protein
MFFWISESLAAPTQYYEAPSGLKLRGGETYLEAVWPGSVLGLGPEFHLVVYWIRMTDTDAFVGTCWGNHFDFVTNLSSNEVLDRAFVRGATRAWPVFTELASETGPDGRQKRGVLIFSPDPDHGQIKGFVGTYLRGVNLDDTAGLLEGRSLETARGVVDLSAEVLTEQIKTPVWKLPEIWDAIGAQRRADVENSWISRLDTILNNPFVGVIADGLKGF